MNLLWGNGGGVASLDEAAAVELVELVVLRRRHFQLFRLDSARLRVNLRNLQTFAWNQKRNERKPKQKLKPIKIKKWKIKITDKIEFKFLRIYASIKWMSKYCLMWNKLDLKIAIYLSKKEQILSPILHTPTVLE